MPTDVKPRVFIASSVEGQEVARAIQLQLSGESDNVLWSDNVFRPSEYSLESLERELQDADFGIFVLTPDDLTSSRGRRHPSPRDNVVLELGLFVGGFGRRRALAVLPRGSNVKLPTDLLGISYVTYDPPSDLQRAVEALAPACTQIRLYLRSVSARPRHVSWDEICVLTRKLAASLRRSPPNGGYSFDVLVGLSRGGIIVADLLSRVYGGNIPLICLWADRHSSYPATTFAPPENWINRYAISALNDDRARNILVVDDITREGRTLVAAKDLIAKSVPRKRVKSAILLAPLSARSRIDYIARLANTSEMQTPFTLVED